MDTPVLPHYTTGTLADVLPSALAGLGVPGVTNTLELPATRAVCVLLVDGLGWSLLREHADLAPTLTALAAGAEPITVCWPSTTATSLASLGTGLPPGEHGIVGYSFDTGRGELLNALGWARHGRGRPADLRERVVPEEFQPRQTMWERASAAGVAVHQMALRDHRDSGLTRAVLRGGNFHSVHAVGDLVATTVTMLNSADRTLCYAYHADLDLLGHVYGPDSEPFRLQLNLVDHLVSMLVERLPADTQLLITGDHGMVTIGADDRIDFDTHADLPTGVRALGGEARARHVYAKPGAAEDVLATWRAVLGERAWVVSRDEAIDAGWLGPVVTDEVRPRVGDVVAAARGTTAIVRSEVERRLSRLLGHHGSLTAQEQFVPLLRMRS
ncbi:MAG TPA: nucleotide pyrophosphatase/phosphodiesterase family protein [Pseudonocardiaceae bacterium]|nr:nucleotide pyrophosphatase/phosphodiesterase family protein [Pseudonocardiaceae bacterium]